MMNSPSVPGRMPTHSSAIAEYPVRTGFTETTFAPRPFMAPRPILMGLESWSSATPKIIRYFACSQSGSPNSQKEPPMV